jgi:hypothetical protein
MTLWKQMRFHVLAQKPAKTETVAILPCRRQVAKRIGEVRKGARRMPRCQEPKKDGANTEMPRGAVSERRYVDVRMGEPTGRHGPVLLTECIGKWR